jgi:hypothetical protein
VVVVVGMMVGTAILLLGVQGRRRGLGRVPTHHGYGALGFNHSFVMIVLR